MFAFQFKREKIIRLYHENKLLKSKQNDFNEEQLHLIQTQYDDEKQRSTDLQSRLNETCKHKIELECQLNDLKKKDNENNNYLNTSDLQSLKAKDEIIEELRAKLSKFQLQSVKETQSSDCDIKKSTAHIDSISN